MKSTLKSILLGFISIIVTFNASFSQTFGEPVLGAGRLIGDAKLLGIIDNSEILLGFKSILIYEKEKSTSINYPEVNHNGESYKLSKFFVKDDVIVGYFLSNSTNGQGMDVCFVEFSKKFEPLAKPFVVANLPKAVSYKDVDGNAQSGLFKSTYRERQELNCTFDNVSGNILITFVLHLHKKRQESSGSFILMDDKYTILTEAQIEPSDKRNFYKMEVEKVYDNGDCLISIYEGNESYTSNGMVYSIKSTNMIYLPGDGSDIVELGLMPVYGYVGEIIPASNISDDGTISYGIISKETKEYLSKGALTIYFYNTKTKKEWSETISSADLTKLNDGKEIYLSREMAFIQYLKNDDMLVALQFAVDSKGEKSKAMVLKLDKNLDVIWHQKIGVITYQDDTYGKMFCHFDVASNILYFIQNIHPRLLKDGKLTLQYELADAGSGALLGKLDVTSEEIEYSMLGNEQIKFRGLQTWNILPGIDEEDYLFYSTVNGKLRYIPVTFD